MGANVTKFEIEGQCRSKNATLDCTIGWTQTSNGSQQITHIGPYAPDEFEANGDLAGIGTLLSFLIPTGVSLLIAPIMLLGMSVHANRNKSNSPGVKRFVPKPGRRRRPTHQAIGQPQTSSTAVPPNERMYNILEAILTATSDYQSVFGAALCIYFAAIGKCSISMYHFMMGLDLIILICANSLLVIVYTRHFWRTPFSSLGRLAACGLLLYYSGAILWLIQQRHESYGTVEWSPPRDRNNSLILLQAACLLDPDPLRKLINLSDDPALNASRAAVIGPLEQGEGILPAYIFWYILVACFGLAVVFRGINLGFRNKADNDLGVTPKGGTFWRRVRVTVCLLTLFLCFSTYIYLIIHIFNLRQWVFDSGWLKNDAYLGNEEVAISSFGQVAALCALIGFALTGMDRIEWKTRI